MILHELDVNAIEWQRQGACRNDPGPFDSLMAETKADPKAAEKARAVCSGCAVRVDCLRYAMKTRQTKGMWGGLTAKQRASLRKRLKRRAEARLQQQRETEGG